MAKVKFTIITLFQEALKPYLDSSMLYKAQHRGIIEVEYVDLREFGLGPHKQVDDTPYGGGDGMLLRCEPVFAAIENVKAKDPQAKVILPTPVGEVWTQALARKFALLEPQDGPENSNLATTPLLTKTASEADFEALDTKTATVNPQKTVQNPMASTLVDQDKTTAASPQKSQNLTASTPDAHYIILCPHYEGYDERIMTLVDYPISIGNYVLTGGELPALIIVDSITRLLPGVLGGETSAAIESFSEGDNLEYPQYTKPADFRGMTVPEVLLSGHHANVEKWRAEQSRLRTEARARRQK